MFTRILLPTDGTAHEREVLHAAKTLAEREAARLVLIHVDADASADLAGTRASLLDLASELRGDGVDARTAFAFGRPEDAIAAAAREHEADVILISPRRRPLVTALLDPGVTSKLLKRAPAPLLIWPERLDARAMETLLGSTIAPVIVPLDGSLEAERALPLAEAFAREHDRVLMLAHVAVPVPFIGLEVPYPVSADSLEERAEEGRHYLEATRRRVAKRTGLTVQSMVLSGGAASELAWLGEAHPGALIVMTTHGRGPVARLLLGSVAAEVIGIATVPVLVVPPAQPAHARQPIAERAGRLLTQPRPALGG